MVVLARCALTAPSHMFLHIRDAQFGGIRARLDHLMMVGARPRICRTRPAYCRIIEWYVNAEFIHTSALAAVYTHSHSPSRVPWAWWCETWGTAGGGGDGGGGGVSTTRRCEFTIYVFAVFKGRRRRAYTYTDKRRCEARIDVVAFSVSIVVSFGRCPFIYTRIYVQQKDAHTLICSKRVGSAKFFWETVIMVNWFFVAIIHLYSKVDARFGYWTTVGYWIIDFIFQY